MKTIIKYRIDGGVEVDPADLNSVMEGSRKIEEIKSFCASKGVLIDMTAKMGNIREDAKPASDESTPVDAAS